VANEIMVVLTNPAEGQEDEFNRFYDERHVPDVLALGPFVSAQRFRLAPASLGSPEKYRYLAIYEIAEGRLEEARDVLVRLRAERDEAEAAGREPLLPVSPAIDDDRLTWLFEAVTERLEAPAAERAAAR